MKTILLVLLAAINVNAKTIKEGDTTYTCNPVKTCDEKLQQAYAEIAKLKKQLKNQKIIIKEVTVEKPMVYRFETIKKVHKYHIVSIILLPTIDSVDAKVTSPTTAKAEANSSYKPGITYQYQFESGIVPQAGLLLNGNVLLGVGLEF